ncbi:MAG: thiolase domain-containing protein [Chloroflexota bacterium]|nr:MAG: thiolase domain-containing protein [Chloroflexota bacterium]
MRKVAVLGIGQTKISEHWGISLKEIAGNAIFAALEDAERESVDGIFIGNMLSGSLNKQENLGSLLADWAGLKPVEGVKIETACSSGGSALRAGLIAVASGEMDSALVVGVEKMSDAKLLETTSALATAADADYETVHGLSFVALNALIMQRYLHQYGWDHVDFAPFSINAHQNGARNPYARLQSIITEKEYQDSRMVAKPINLLDASPIGDGAAAVLLVAAKIPQNNGISNLVEIIASAVATDTLSIHDRKDPLRLSAAEISARRAYSQAGIEPDEIDVFELHDAFTIMAALSLEACGFSPPGQGPRLGLDGEITPDGRIPISTFGGLKARGHPVGATGVYQIVELVTQLRGEAGENQIEQANIGMAQNIGGSGATAVTHILKKN